MFGEYLFNITNTSLWNISIDSRQPRAVHVARPPSSTCSSGAECRATSTPRRPPTARLHIPQTIPWPAPVPVDWRQPFDLAQLFPEYLVENPLTPHESQNLYNTIDCSLDSVGGPDDILGVHTPRRAHTHLHEVSDRNGARLPGLPHDDDAERHARPVGALWHDAVPRPRVHLQDVAGDHPRAVAAAAGQLGAHQRLSHPFARAHARASTHNSTRVRRSRRRRRPRSCTRRSRSRRPPARRRSSS